MINLLLGIDNSFILENMFGSADIFKNAEIINIIWRLYDSRMEFEIQTKCKVINLSDRWKNLDWNYINIIIELFGANKVNLDVNQEKIHISSLDIKEDGSRYIIKIYSGNKCCIESKFDIARIHNVKPVYLEK